jgi:hypothetical protein
MMTAESAEEILRWTKIAQRMRDAGSTPQTDAEYRVVLAHLRSALANRRGAAPNPAARPTREDRLRAQVQAYRHLTRNVSLTPDLIRETGLPQGGGTGTAAMRARQCVYRTSEAMSAAQDREDRVRARLQHRVEELRVVVPMLRVGDQAERAARTELRSLGLIDLQKKLRSHVAAEMRAALVFESARAGVAAWRRELVWGACAEHRADDTVRVQATVEQALAHCGNPVMNLIAGVVAR